MTVLSSLLAMGARGAWKTAKMATGNPLQRALVGAGAGGLYGYASSDFTGTRALGDAFGGALGGAMLGVGSSMLSARGILGSGIGAGKVALKGIGFTIRHPQLVAGGVAAAALGPGLVMSTMGGQNGVSPSLSGVNVNTSYNQQMIAAESMMMGGISPMGGVGTQQQFTEMQQRRTQNQRMMNSTYGLTNGLHRGRHG